MLVSRAPLIEMRGLKSTGLCSSDGEGGRGGKIYYVVQFGNNSVLVRNLLRLRAWQEAFGEFDAVSGKLVRKRVKGEVQVLWTQYKNQEFLDAKFARKSVRVVCNKEKSITVKKGATDSSLLVHNHFEGVGWMCTKRGLLETLEGTDLQPKSWTIKKSQEVKEAKDKFLAEAEAGVYIVKPGEFSNRGSGIKLFKSPETAADQIEDFLARENSIVLQKYIEKPLLYEGRKFDIRSYGLISSEDGRNFEFFFYPDVYVRTASELYDLRNLDNRLVHLNNDAVQKHGKNYGKNEVGNKLTLEALCRKLKIEEKKILEGIRTMTHTVFKLCAPKLNPRCLTHCFEVVGFDWMIDCTGRLFLIEVNTNPCLELVSSWLAHVIPAMIDGALSLTVDKWTRPHPLLASHVHNKWVPLH